MLAARDPLNITIIGDGAASISHMIVTKTEDQFLEDFCPRFVDSVICDILVDGTMVPLKLWPAPGLSMSFF